MKKKITNVMPKEHYHMIIFLSKDTQSLDTFLLHCNNSRNVSAILLRIQNVVLENKLFFLFLFFVNHQEFACVCVHDRCGWVLGA